MFNYKSDIFFLSVLGLNAYRGISPFDLPDQRYEKYQVNINFLLHVYIIQNDNMGREIWMLKRLKGYILCILIIPPPPLSLFLWDSFFPRRIKLPDGCGGGLPRKCFECITQKDAILKHFQPCIMQFSPYLIFTTKSSFFSPRTAMYMLCISINPPPPPPPKKPPLDINFSPKV